MWTLRAGSYHHRRKSSRPKANTIRPSHPAKLHILGGVTWDGPIPFVYFENNLTSESYAIMIDHHSAPFMRSFNKGNSRIFQDNAPTHVTRIVYQSLARNDIRWVKQILH